MITVSIVSHGHASWIEPLLQDLAACPEISRVILTVNIPDRTIPVPEELKDKMVRLCNTVPQGFGANHNAAFRECQTPYFCILNPDMRLLGNPFEGLLQGLDDRDVALAAPFSMDQEGRIQDSVRYFPRPCSLMMKAINGQEGRYQADRTQVRFPVEWVSGMFMLIRSLDFSRIGGFDERYYLYYEDVDLCVRLWKARRQVLACSDVKVVHEAQRASHHDWTHFRWHVKSLARYLLKYLFRLPRIY
ncbi:MAG: glycosyltransferase family 2 protein [Proteobacteria bacterium]|nr:glycosyltransferase family 2 protein [Pseudomonadota bacterium]MDE3208795.1 glycosyltransferase family 2 protein [Pseudomonadota bacterium]